MLFLKFLLILWLTHVTYIKHKDQKWLYQASLLEEVNTMKNSKIKTVILKSGRRHLREVPTTGLWLGTFWSFG